MAKSNAGGGAYLDQLYASVASNADSATRIDASPELLVNELCEAVAQHEGESTALRAMTIAWFGHRSRETLFQPDTISSLVAILMTGKDDEALALLTGGLPSEVSTFCFRLGGSR